MQRSRHRWVLGGRRGRTGSGGVSNSRSNYQNRSRPALNSAPLVSSERGGRTRLGRRHHGNRGAAALRGDTAPKRFQTSARHHSFRVRNRSREHYTPRGVRKLTWVKGAAWTRTGLTAIRGNARMPYIRLASGQRQGRRRNCTAGGRRRWAERGTTRRRKMNGTRGRPIHRGAQIADQISRSRRRPQVANSESGFEDER